MTWEFEVVVESLGYDTNGTEGPVWDGNTLLFSHSPSDSIMRYDPRTGMCTRYVDGANRTNGMAMDVHGTLFGCMAGQSCIAKFHDDGSFTKLPNVWGGIGLDRPNDVVIDRSGRIWFSDGPGRAFGGSAERETLQSIMRLDPQPDGGYTLHRMTTDTTAPNGLQLSRDERTLYVANGSYSSPVRELRAYPLSDDDTLGTYRVLHTWGRDKITDEQKKRAASPGNDFAKNFGLNALGAHRGIDGMCLTTEGYIVAATGYRHAGPGPMIYVFDTDGREVETHPTPFARPTNLTFGDPGLSTLYLTTGGGDLWRVCNSGYRGFVNHLN